MHGTLTTFSLNAQVAKYEPWIPLLLSVHGTVMLLSTDAGIWQWLCVGIMYLFFLWGISRQWQTDSAIAIRAALLFVIATFLLATTGGVNSFLLFAYFILVISYPIVLEMRHAFILWGAVPLAYLSLFFFDTTPLPFKVVFSRIILFVSFSLLAYAVKSTFRRYVAERQQTTEALRRSEQYFRAMIEHASDVIVVLNRDGAVRYASPSAARILGYTLERLSIEELIQIVHPRDWESCWYYVWNTDNSTPENSPIEVRIQQQAGHWLVFELVRSNLLNDPAINGIVLNARNVTERKQLDAQFRQAQKMEAIGQLTTGIAHDFNNLLIPIQGSAELLQLKIPTDDPSHKIVGRILESSARATNLIRHLLAFSRKEVIELKSLNLNCVVWEMDNILGTLLGSLVERKLVLAPDLWDILADSTQIEQILMNLAVNARDAMPDGGQLTIRTVNLVLDEQSRILARDSEWKIATGDYVCLTVQDTGSGMDDHVKTHIFEPFFTTKQHDTGTGMGLATVYAIVRQSDGYITIDSEEGRGTTFSLFFPRATFAVHRTHHVNPSDAAEVHNQEAVLG